MSSAIASEYDFSSRFRCFGPALGKSSSLRFRTRRLGQFRVWLQRIVGVPRIMAAAGAPGGGDGGLNAEQILRLFQRMKEEDRRDSLPKNIAALIQKFQPRFA